MTVPAFFDHGFAITVFLITDSLLLLRAFEKQIGAKPKSITAIYRGIN